MIVGGDSTRPSDYLERVQDLVEMDEVTKGLAWWEGTRIAEDSVLRTRSRWLILEMQQRCKMTTARFYAA